MTDKLELAGLRDKLFWRQVSPGSYHCFKKHRDGGYVSLCGEWRMKRSQGQKCARPPCIRRCARCDVAEIERRGVDESMPESKGWGEWGVQDAQLLDSE
jgi:hypothetical protein